MAKPSIQERASMRLCPNCGKPSPERRSPHGSAPLYCRPEGGRDCRRELNNRNLTDGAALMPYLRSWRINRGSGGIAKSSFARICSILDELNSEYREAGLPHPDIHTATLLMSNDPLVSELRYGRKKLAAFRAKNAPGPA